MISSLMSERKPHWSTSEHKSIPQSKKSINDRVGNRFGWTSKEKNCCWRAFAIERLKISKGRAGERWVGGWMGWPLPCGGGRAAHKRANILWSDQVEWIKLALAACPPSFIFYIAISIEKVILRLAAAALRWHRGQMKYWAADSTVDISNNSARSVICPRSFQQLPFYSSLLPCSNK